jgi:hypothetical protein
VRLGVAITVRSVAGSSWRRPLSHWLRRRPAATNTAPLAQAPGSFIASTDDFSQVECGLKMLCAASKLCAARCLVLQGKERHDEAMPLLGRQLRFVPAKDFLDEYQSTPVDDLVRAMAAEYMKRARRVFQASTNCSSTATARRSC